MLDIKCLPIDFKYHKQMIENHLLVHENSSSKERKESGIKNAISIKIKNSDKGLIKSLFSSHDALHF